MTDFQFTVIAACYYLMVAGIVAGGLYRGGAVGCSAIGLAAILVVCFGWHLKNDNNGHWVGTQSPEKTQEK